MSRPRQRDENTERMQAIQAEREKFREQFRMLFNQQVAVERELGVAPSTTLYHAVSTIEAVALGAML